MATSPTVARRSSLRVELIAMLTIVLVMAVVSLSFTAEWLGQRRHDRQEVERLQSHARGLAVLVARSVSGGDVARDTLDALLHDSSAQLGVSYEVHRLRSDGELERLASVGVHAGFEALPAPARADAGARVHDELLDRYNLLVIDEPIPTLDREQLSLRMIAEHSSWARTHAWREMLIVAGGVGLVLLVLGGLLLELQVLRPMRALEAAAARVGAGELEIQAPTDGPSEFAQLGHAFNEMLASLRRQQDELAAQSQKLRRSEQLAAVGRVAAGVAHEVGNPLAAIVGYTELLLGEPSLDADSHDLLARVQAQTQRIQGIVAQLLDYARPSKHQLLEVRVHARAEEVVALLRADPRCAEVELAVEGDPELEARADPALVEQILINLVLNAAEAAREGPQPGSAKVEVRVHALGPGTVALDVCDNGAGVPEDVRPRLFEPFFTTRGAGQGTGLGLAISQGLAHGMGGELVCLESESESESGPGREVDGAVFRLTFARVQRVQ